MSTGELWMSHFSMSRWTDPVVWDKYLEAAESLLGDRLEKLDVNDPARRRVNDAGGQGQFIVQFGEREASRWLWGKFAKTKIEFEIKHYECTTDSFGRLRPNSVSFYVPESMAIGQNVRPLIALFRFSNEQLKSFYAYADFKTVICAKKPSTPSLDISRELLGIFWLTYFGSHYCAFFGRERMIRLKEASDGPADGLTLQLAEAPGQIPDDERTMLERQIASESFAGTGGPKAPGQHALTLAQLTS